MNPVSIPLVPQWNTISGTASTPTGGFLYIGSKTVNYISKIVDNEPPIMKVFYTRQRVKCLDCDPNWTETQFFVTLADDNSVQIWDFNDGKVVKGHKGHIKAAKSDWDGQPSDTISLCFLKNSTVLSIDSTHIIIYCVSSNTYSKYKRIIPIKHQISIVRGSPLDERIFAAGTINGLILIVDLKSEKILYTLRGHDTEITSLSWWVSQPTTHQIKSKHALKMEKLQVFGPSDDLFDIYDYGYLESDEFGASAIKPKVPSDEETLLDSSANTQPMEVVENDNFNFVEACQNLREDIINSREDKSGKPSCSQPQVTLKDCGESMRMHSDSSFSCNSYQSLDLSDRSDESSGDDDEIKEMKKEMNLSNLSNSKVEDSRDVDIFLASGSHEPVVWIWNTKTGGSVDKIQLKNPPGNTQNSFIDVCWYNDQIIVNNKVGELTLWNQTRKDPNKISFRLEKRDFTHRGVTAVCVLKNSDLVWTISSYRKIICEDLKTGTVVANYSCASSNIAAIRERPDDMNKIAFACADRRIGLIDISNLTAKNISIENFSNKIDSSVLSLCWSPDDRYLAFGTIEGRVGVLDTDKPTHTPVILKPFSGKAIYSMDWFGKHIFVCSNERIGVYEWTGHSKDPLILNQVENASSIATTQHYLLVGTQNGYLSVYKRSNVREVNYRKLSDMYIGPKYISEISINPINKQKFAVCSLNHKIFILNLLPNDELEVIRILEMTNAGSGNSWVKWSNKNENLLLSCGFDGSVHVWDLEKTSKEMIFTKQFQCPMLCGIFDPRDENVVICAGKATSIEMFNMKIEKNSQAEKIPWNKNREKLLGNVQWATKLQNDLMHVKEKKKNRKRKQQGHVAEANEVVAEQFEKLDLQTNEEAAKQDENMSICSFKNPTTIMHLIAKEMNKDSLHIMLEVLWRRTENFDATSGSSRKFLPIKLFGTKTEVRDVLNEELKNHQTSNTKSIGEIILPQIAGNLKDEILERIKSKTLAEFHVSLAPSISYDFWRKCCIAYANQLLEKNLSLQVIPYLLACHETKECIEKLLHANYHREAWMIAKIHREEGDAIFKVILDKWIEYLESTGHLEGASLLCVLSNRFEQAKNILARRRQPTKEHVEILEILKNL